MRTPVMSMRHLVDAGNRVARLLSEQATDHAKIDLALDTWRDVVAEASEHDSGVFVENSRGEWVPAIPEPLYVTSTDLFRRVLNRWDRKCDCGEIFQSRRSYNGHYAYAHILGLS